MTQQFLMVAAERKYHLPSRRRIEKVSRFRPADETLRPKSLWGSLPVNFLISSSISSLPFDFGILPRNKRVFGSLTFILRLLPSAISYESSCGKGRQLIVFVHKSEKYRKKKKTFLS